MSGIGPKEQKGIDDVVARFHKDKAKFASIVQWGELPSPPDAVKRKYKKGLLAVTKYRVLILTKKGKFALERDFPLIEMREIGGGEFNIVWLGFLSQGRPTYLVVESNNYKEFVKAVRESYRQMSWAWDQEDQARLSIEPSALDALDPNFKQDVAGGFTHTYKAWSNLRGTPPMKAVIQFVRDLGKRGVTDLDLGMCPGVEFAKTALTFDIVTIGYALQRNPYFRSVTIRDVTNRDAATAIAAIFQYNTRMRRVAISNTQSEMPPLLGEALRRNTRDQLSIIDLSETAVNPAFPPPFSAALRSCTHLIKVMDLTNTRLGPRGVGAVVHAFRINWGMSLGIQELSISGNPMDPNTASFFTAWLKDMAEYSALRRLGVANTGLELGTFFHRLKGYELEYLDISDNKFDRTMEQTMVAYIEGANNLRILKMAGVAMPPPILAKILGALFKNPRLQGLHIDLSRSGIGPKEMSALGTTLQQGGNLHTLNMADNLIRASGGMTLLQSLQPSIVRLILDGNFEEEADNFTFCQTLGSFLNSHPSLTALSIAGRPKRILGTAIVPFFKELQGNTSLIELDLSFNQMGDAAFTLLCNSLRNNTGLKTLQVDGNLVGVNGYLAFLQMLDVNKTLAYLFFPVQDFGMFGSVKFREVITDIQYLTYRRADLALKRTAMTTIFDFNLRWPTPEDRKSVV